MTHLNNMPETRSSATPFDWIVGICFALIVLVLALAALTMAIGCKAQPTPTTQAIIAPAESAKSHAVNASNAVKQATPFVAEQGKPFILTAQTEVDAIIPDLEQQITQSINEAKRADKLAQDNVELKAKLVRADAAHRSEMEQAKQTADARWKKEHEDHVWLGWKTQTYLKAVFGSILGLIGLTVAVGIIGTLFPAAWPFLTLSYNFLKTVIGVVTLGAGRIAPLIQRFDNWFDSHVEAWRRGKAIPEGKP